MELQIPFANLLPFYGSCNLFFVVHEWKIRYLEEKLQAKKITPDQYNVKQETIFHIVGTLGDKKYIPYESSSNNQ